MSSSPSSSSSDSPVPAESLPAGGGAQPSPDDAPVPSSAATAVTSTEEQNDALAVGLGDVLCPLSVEIGSGTLAVREVIELCRSTILGMTQPAGQDLSLIVNGVTLAMGEIVIVEDTTAIRVTQIVRVPGTAAEADS